MDLRPYQTEVYDGIHAEWCAGTNNVLAVLPTGGGKTVIFSNVIRNHVGACCAIAHRQELVEQISLALACEGIKHKIIAPQKIIRSVVTAQRNKYGRDFYGR